MPLTWLKRYKTPLAFAAVFAVFWSIGFHRYDPDFGWHLVSGQHFTEHGIPATDIFTYTATDFPWVNHEWLADVLLAGLYNMGGYSLLAVVYAALWTGSLALMTKGRGPWYALLAAAFALAPYVGVRAMVWTFVMSALLYTILNLSKRRWGLIIPLFILWANLHGGFPIGFAYIVYILYVKRSWYLALLAVLAALGTLITPYGTETYVEIIRTMSDPHLKENVREWSSLRFDPTFTVYAGVWCIALLLAAKRAWRRYIRFDVALFIGVLTAIRHTPLFILFSLPHTSRYFRETPPLRIQKGDGWLFAIAGVIAAGALGGLVWISKDYFYGNRDESYPVASVNYLRNHPCNGRLFNHYDVGGYLIWQLPSHKVFIDGRMPSWRENGEHIMMNYYRIVDDNAYRKEQFEKYDISCVIWRSDTSFSNKLKQEGWRVAPDTTEYYQLLLKP